jgi:hypothetical protein
MTCRKCGHTNGMHDEGGCVALNCACNRYIPAEVDGIPSIQPPRPPLNVPRISRSFGLGSRTSLG